MARKILLADDSVTAQNMGRKILADAGYEVITVNNGSAALKRIGEQRPDVIVLDVYMPGYSGLEVCQRLKEVGDTSRIPILLTVGKLEPFKPEEAKRVRADGFIVKPFEASELLSALTRLEDKIVPRNEPSKPGRFARLAMEDGRYDKTMAAEEDTSWKNRLAFPTKKKDKERDSEPEEAVAHNIPKDARSTTEQVRSEAPSSQEKVDLGALATTGLPKDVTPEEIAALAAAAARMKGKADERPPEPTSEMLVVAPPELPNIEDTTPIGTPEVPILTATPSADETKETESKVEVEPEPAGSAIVTPEVHAEAEAVTAAMPPSSQEMTEVASEPFTMAVAAGVGESSSQASRWTAVSVALAPEDEAISLEHEMQKAYSTFAAAESVNSTSSPTDFLNAAGIAPLESTIPATVAPEAILPLSAVAEAATEVVTAAVKELENVASSYAARQADAVETSSPASAEQQNVPTLAAELQKVAPAAPESAEVFGPDSHPEVQPLQQERALDCASSQPAAEPVSPAVVQAISPLESTLGTEVAPLPQPTTTDTPAEEETAAMAAAVGGRPVEELSSDADPAIATIVDSVLANLRPKIVEEISRKLGKK